MRIFLDTEFTELNQNARLISIGLAAENGDVFYAELIDAEKYTSSSWVKEHVVPLLSGSLPPAEMVETMSVVLCRGDEVQISSALKKWFSQFGGKNSVEIWADVLAWDWVLFCELFGGAFNIPDQVFYIPFDLSTLMKIKGINPDADRESLGSISWNHPALQLKRHHALYDALLELEIFRNVNQ